MELLSESADVGSKTPEADCGQLHAEAQTVLVTPTPDIQGSVGIIEQEVPLQQLRLGAPVKRPKAAISASDRNSAPTPDTQAQHRSTVPS